MTAQRRLRGCRRCRPHDLEASRVTALHRGASLIRLEHAHSEDSILISRIFDLDQVRHAGIDSGDNEPLPGWFFQRPRWWKREHGPK